MTARILRSVDELRAVVGTELGVSDWLEVTQEQIDTFAVLTRDHEWIHVDVDRAATGPFGGTIAHGFLTLSFIPGFAAEIYRLELDRATVNYGLDKVRFPAPVPVGSRLRARVGVTAVEPHAAGTLVRLSYVVEAQEPQATVCVAESLLLALA